MRHPRGSNSNASGRSSPTVVVSRGPPGRPRCTGVSGARELREPLPAAAAGRAELHVLGGHGHLGDLGLAGGDERADRRGLGALALRIGRVLDVRADVDAPVRRAQRGADREAASRARRRCASPRRRRASGSSGASACAPPARSGARASPRAAGPSSSSRPGSRPRSRAPRGAARRLSCSPAQVRAGLRHRLELDVAPQPLDLVEVDADALPEQQPSPLRDRRRASRRRRRAPRAAARRRRRARAGRCSCARRSSPRASTRSARPRAATRRSPARAA